MTDAYKYDDRDNDESEQEELKYFENEQEALKNLEIIALKMKNYGNNKT